MAQRKVRSERDITPGSVQIRLESFAAGGEAVGRVDAMVVFVPGGLPGELVTVQIVDQRSSYARARLVSVEEASPNRAHPRCRHFGACGGCTWQHLAYAEQVRAKGQIVRDQLTRIGRLPDVPVRECIASPDPWGYRNSTRVAFTGDGRPGYRAAASHEIVAVEECPILQPSLQARLTGLRPIAPGKGEFDLRVPMTPITIAGVSYEVPLAAFFQVNSAVAELLVGEVLAGLALRPDDAVLDLYCGVGLFTVPIAAEAGRVVGVEVSEAAVRGARMN